MYKIIGNRGGGTLMFLITLSTDNDNADSDKIERLYHKYYRLMYYVANKILQDNYLAEDAVQTAFLKLIPNLHKIEDINSHKTKAFVVIVVENVAKRMYTKRRKIKQKWVCYRNITRS